MRERCDCGRAWPKDDITIVIVPPGGIVGAKEFGEEGGKMRFCPSCDHDGSKRRKALEILGGSPLVDDLPF